MATLLRTNRIVDVSEVILGVRTSCGSLVVSPTLYLKVFIHPGAGFLISWNKLLFGWHWPSTHWPCILFFLCFFSFFILSATSESALFFVKFLLDRKCGPWTAAFQAPRTEFHRRHPTKLVLESECACFVQDVCGM